MILHSKPGNSRYTAKKKKIVGTTITTSYMARIFRISCAKPPIICSKFECYPIYSSSVNTCIVPCRASFISTLKSSVKYIIERCLVILNSNLYGHMIQSACFFFRRFPNYSAVFFSFLMRVSNFPVRHTRKQRNHSESPQKKKNHGWGRSYLKQIERSFFKWDT